MKKIAVSIQEAIEMTGISRSAFYLLFNAGTIVPRKYGKRTLILVSDLDAYIRSLPAAEFVDV